MQENASELADPSSKLILIVDDDESILDLMEHVIRKEGFRTERATEGNEALRKAQANAPDMIVLDFMLPGVGGFEIIKELQAGDTARVPILVITGRHMDRQAIEMIRHEQNVKDFMPKPIRPALLTATLHKVLKTRPPDIRRGSDRGPLSGGW